WGQMASRVFGGAGFPTCLFLSARFPNRPHDQRPRVVRVCCPGCRQPLQVPPEHLGRVIRCPACKQTFTLRLPPPPLPRLEVASATSPGRARERNEDALLTHHLAWSDSRGRHELALL